MFEFFTWSFVLYSLQMQKEIVSDLKKISEEPWHPGLVHGCPGPFYLENGDSVLENLSPLAQVLLMKLVCKKQLIIYINNIKIIIIS